MFKKLAKVLTDKFGRRDYFSRQLEIVKVFDIYENETGIRPGSLKNKKLVVLTTSSVQASELRLREQDIIKKINQELDREALKKIIYRF